MTVLGSFDTLAQLVASHPVGNVGDAYLVGGDLYVWSAETGTWVNVGNIRGPQGEPGQTGATGPQGIQGQPGPQGVQGVQGLHGEPGPTGPEGPTGSQGIQGVIGPTGPQGIPGETGPQGVQGIQGLQGEPGPAGSAGVTGATGPVGASGNSPSAVYHANLSASGSYVDVPVSNVIYRLQYSSSTQLTLFLRPATVPVLIDLKRASQYDITTVDGFTRDNYTLSTSLDIDTIIYNSSREMHRTWLRQQDPVTGFWSLSEIDLFASNGNARITIWVYQIYTNAVL